MNDAVGMRILWFLPNNLSIFTLHILESLPIPVIYVGGGLFFKGMGIMEEDSFSLIAIRDVPNSKVHIFHVNHAG